MELVLDRVSKQFGSAIAVDRVSAAFGPGVYGLLGANGAGKTTLMRMICDVLKPTSGSVLWNGAPISRLGADYRSQLGYLPQDFGYYPEFTAIDFMMYLSALKGLDSKTARRRSYELLHLVGLRDVAKRKVRTFSGGMKQRLGIAQAVINDPSVLVLDEPTAGLDPKERVRFRNLIASLAQDKVVMLSTHIVSDVEYIADEILVMKAGSIMATGTVEEIVQGVAGCVWECVMAPREADAMAARTTVGNLHYDRDGMAVVRLVSKTRPHEAARQVTPTLEDVYLYLFDERPVDDGGAQQGQPGPFQVRTGSHGGRAASPSGRGRHHG